MALEFDLRLVEMRYVTVLWSKTMMPHTAFRLEARPPHPARDRLPYPVTIDHM